MVKIKTFSILFLLGLSLWIFFIGCNPTQETEVIYATTVIDSTTTTSPENTTTSVGDGSSTTILSTTTTLSTTSTTTTIAAGNSTTTTSAPTTTTLSVTTTAGVTTTIATTTTVSSTTSVGSTPTIASTTTSSNIATTTTSSVSTTTTVVDITTTTTTIGVVIEESSPGNIPSGLKIYNNTSVITGNLNSINWKRFSTVKALALAGGGRDVTNAMTKLLTDGGRGDVVILRMDDPDDATTTSIVELGYGEYFYGLDNSINSITEVVFDPALGNTYEGTNFTTLQALANTTFVETLIKNAEVLFIAGGNQRKYYDAWNGTKVEDAIRYLINTKKIPIAGTSAGMHFLGLHIYAPKDASNSFLALQYNDDADFKTDVYGKIVSDFCDGDVPAFLSNTIIDTHFSQRNRMGRLIVMMARLIKDKGVAPTSVKGIACDEGTCLYIDENGNGKVYNNAGMIGYAYMVKGNSTPEVNTHNTPLTWNNSGNAVLTYRIAGSETPATANSFNLSTWTPGSAESYYGYVDAGSYRVSNNKSIGAFKDDYVPLTIGITKSDTIQYKYDKWYRVDGLTVGNLYTVNLTEGSAKVSFVYLKAPCKANSMAFPSDIYYGESVAGQTYDSGLSPLPTFDAEYNEWYWTSSGGALSIDFTARDTTAYLWLYAGSAGNGGSIDVNISSKSGGGGDATPPQWLTGYPKKSSTYNDEFLVKTDEDCTVYFIAVATGSTAPTSAQVKAGVNYSSVTKIDSHSKSIYANSEGYGYLASSVATGSYDVYIVAQDSSGNIQTAPVKLVLTK